MQSSSAAVPPRRDRFGLHAEDGNQACSKSKAVSRFASHRTCRIKSMRIIHKCPVGQGSGSPSPKEKAWALAPSQSYRFVSNPHGLYPCFGRRPQIFAFDFPILIKSGKARNLRAENHRPAGASGEINAALEPVLEPSSIWSEDPRKLPGLISNSCKSPEGLRPPRAHLYK